jgi:YegS/Rv2252/BmrU family lipid kinase
MRIKLILDPYAGGGKGKRFLPQIKRVLGKGNLLDVFLTKGPGQALLSAQEAARKDFNIIVVGGGDGTLNEVINGILMIRSNLPVGLVPLGVANDAAWALGIPMDPLKACEIVLKGKMKRIDLGKATKPNLRYFLSMADYGYVGSVLHKVESKFQLQLFKFKLHLEKILYLINSYIQLFKYRFPSLEVKINDSLHKGYIVVVSNSGYYMGNFRIAPQAVIDDGYLDVCLFKKRGKLDMHRYFLSLLFNKLYELSDVEFYRGKKVSITSSEKTPGTIDGDPFGFTPAEFEIAPQILPVIVP